MVKNFTVVCPDNSPLRYFVNRQTNKWKKTRQKALLSW